MGAAGLGCHLQQLLGDALCDIGLTAVLAYLGGRVVDHDRLPIAIERDGGRTRLCQPVMAKACDEKILAPVAVGDDSQVPVDPQHGSGGRSSASGYGDRSTIEDTSRTVVIGSAWRCAILQAPSSRRKIVVTRKAI